MESQPAALPDQPANADRPASPDRPLSPDRPYVDRFWQSGDGLRLHYRDYPGRADRPPVLILHGLTRNARDGAALAERLAGEWRVIVPEMRGRGQSDYAKDTATYTPAHYVADVEALLADQGIARFVSIGTSLGGLMTLLMAATGPERIAGALLNDVGPELAAEGLAQIRDYVGQGGSYPTWMHAARALQDTFGAAHPGFALEDWLAMAKRVMVLGAGGRIAFDYDMGLAEPLLAADPDAAAPDLWPAFDALAAHPLALVRGELSTLLTAQAAQRMQARAPGMELTVIPHTGHAPTLSEPAAIAAAERLLARIG